MADYEAKSKDSDEESVTSTTRETWGNRLDFALSCIAFSVGLGNVWRFPYLCYKNGGGSFLIPYAICIVLGGIPVFFLEVAMGQYMSLGGVKAWDICPIFKGIGIGTIVIVFYLNIYYIIVLAWDLFYLAMSFQSTLPWSTCDNYWNTPRCRLSPSAASSVVTYNSSFGNSSECSSNATCWQSAINISDTVDPTVEFWERRVLQISRGIDYPDGMVWELSLTLTIVWIMVYFCVWRGVGWGGKVAYFTATFPYILLGILLVRGLTLPGAMDGIRFYLKPDFTKLTQAQVWLDAGTQIFYSYAIGLGAMIALGSYNKFKNNCYRDCIVISTINSCTSLFAGFVIFSVLGFMAKDQGKSIHEVAEKGPGLAFIAYPKAVTQMPIPQMWAVLFFFMVLLLGLGSQFVGVESITTVMLDAYPSLRRTGKREIGIGVYCFISYLCGLSMVTRGGMYVFQLFDYYSASGMALLWVGCFECIAIGWVYGVGRFYDNLEMMLGFRINPYMMACWRFLTPLVTSVIFIWMWAQFSWLKYNVTYIYPWWAQTLGLFLAFSSMMCVPVYLIYKLLITPGANLTEKWRLAAMPKLKIERIPEKWPDHQALVQNSAREDEGFMSCMKPRRQYEMRAANGNKPETDVALMTSYKL